MKTVLWLAAAASALAAGAFALHTAKKRGALRQPLALGPPVLDLYKTQVIEIVPLDPTGFLDPVTERLLEELADQALFLK